MDKYIIKQADLSDLDYVAQLFDQYRVFYNQTSDLEGGRKFIRERMENYQSVIFLALENEKSKVYPLGFVQLYPSFSSVSMKKLWILNDLYVEVSARKRGIARQLMARAIDYASETGAKGLILETAVTNHQAKRLYESIGYKKDVHSDHYEFILK
ncbi:GNAT family N-acetyltransferase [Shimazuella sp. AN120528]|uniref:GNAT family N-acetyltransferase n=1 Tax=Shimazuella soli TaxID=1892854 RepID=UPI001F0F8A4E|nr:GNAT family N-acetyltransferase [Shimazuella soli]MCH5585341.1 GNAT family N-acetyltransferase [Shimazuella soli]